MFLSFIVVLAVVAVVAAKDWHLVSETKASILVGKFFFVNYFQIVK